MKSFRILIIVAIIAFLAYGFLNSPLLETKQTNEKNEPAKTPFMTGEVLVKFKKGTPKRFIIAFKQKLKVKHETFIKSISVYHWQGDFNTDKAIKTLKRSQHVEYAEPNYKVQIQD